MDTATVMDTPSLTTSGPTTHSTQLLAQRSAGPSPDGTGTALEQPSEQPSRFYASAQWTADGTTLIVGASDYSVSSFILPDDLLQPEGDGSQPRQLEPTATTQLPEPTQVITPSPFFSLAHPESQHFLVGCRDHPIQLYPVFSSPDYPGPSYSYKLIRKETEEYLTPSSLIWPAPGTHFVCGSTNRLDYFDVTRPGSEGPVVTMPTIPSKRHISKGSGVGMKGTVSALSASPPDTTGSAIVAAGTWTRWVGMYDFLHTDKAVANWSIADADKSVYQVDLGGQGVVQTMWSPCGKYLLVNERHSDGLLVYDIRGTGRLLSILNGRAHNSQQRLTCDVFAGGDNRDSGFEVWAGSQDGSLLVWDDVGTFEGITEPSRKWNAHAAPIGSTIIHSSGTVAATCSGGWGHSSDLDAGGKLGASPNESYGPQLSSESSLKIWSISNAQPSES